VYPRKTENSATSLANNSKKITRVDAPIVEVSSTFIRQQIKEGKNVKPLLPLKVWEYIDEMNFYK
jgi:nicotinate-nucleotide adenylyltransferase